MPKSTFAPDAPFANTVFFMPAMAQPPTSSLRPWSSSSSVQRYLVGPLFWPFAYFDIYNYAIWGNGGGAPFWGYGYDDIYAGMFAPYAYDDLAGYLPPRVAAPGTPNAAPDRLAQMCGDDSLGIAGPRETAPWRRTAYLGLPLDWVSGIIRH